MFVDEEEIFLQQMGCDQSVLGMLHCVGVILVHWVETYKESSTVILYYTTELQVSCIWKTWIEVTIQNARIGSAILRRKHHKTKEQVINTMVAS